MIPFFKERLQTLLLKRRVALSGQIAAWVGCSLEAVERELAPLIDGGVIERLSPDECKARGWAEDAYAYRATPPRSPPSSPS
jgi:hypothetical protein